MIPPEMNMLSASESRSQTISSGGCHKVPTFKSRRAYLLLVVVVAILLTNCHYDLDQIRDLGKEGPVPARSRRQMILLASSHIVLTKDDNGQSLVLTGEDGGGGKGKGKGKGKGGGGDRLVIAGNNMGGGQNSNMIMQDAANREGDVVINGNSMIVPGEDGHIVLADTRSDQQQQQQPQQRPGLPPNLWAFWAPFLRGRMAYNNPFFGGPFG